MGDVVADFAPVKEHEVWKSPPADYIKINVDANFLESINVASVGVVARNTSGKIFMSSWDFVGQCTSINEAHVRACLAGLYSGITLHQSIILETDSTFAHSFLANEKLDRSPLVDQKRVVLSIAKMLQNLSFKKINRRDNEVAHEIAKFSFNSRSNGLLSSTLFRTVWRML